MQPLVPKNKFVAVLLYCVFKKLTPNCEKQLCGTDLTVKQ